MTAIIAESMLNHIEINGGHIPDEQKGNRRKSRGINDQFLIDKMILRNAKRRKTILLVAWIDYKKSFRLTTSQLDCEKPSNARHQ